MTGFSRRPIAALLCCLFAGAAAAQDDDSALRLALPEAMPPAAIPQAEPDEPIVPAPVLLAAQDVANSPLRVEKRFRIQQREKKTKSAAPTPQGIQLNLTPKTDGDAYPLFLMADEISGQTEELAEAAGHVELRKAGQIVFADQMSYRPLDDEVDARGNVRLLQEGTEIQTPHLRMRLDEQIGFTEQASYEIVREVDSAFYNKKKNIVTVVNANATSANSGSPMLLNVADIYGLPTQQPAPRQSVASGQAERIDFEGDNRMRLTDATYSTCRPLDPDWYLRTAEMTLDQNEGEGSARHASLWFKGVPLMYTPAAWFPTDQRRRSGLLNPSYKQSTKSGLDVTLPVYWNIAPNYDATFYPRMMSKRGLQLGAEGRYLGTGIQSEVRAEYLPDDKETHQERFAYWIRHTQFFTPQLSATVNWQAVSDDTYWEDMSSQLLQTSQVQLPRHVVLNYTPNSWLQTSLQYLSYQTLQPDPTVTITRPYFLEPQLNLVAYKPNVWKTDFSMLGQLTRFRHEDKANWDQGDRLVFYPQFSLPIVHPAFQITPKVGLHMTSYQLDRSQANAALSSNIERVLPTFSVDATMVFEREGELLGKPYVQTLEPRLYYVNIPYKDQGNIPLFDTGLSDFNFAQVFSENRYSGYDRVNDANQLTAALITRVLDGTTGAERFKAMVGQRYYFEEQRVTIPGETVRQKNFSNLIASVSGLLAPKTYAEVAWEYNYKERQNERLSAGVRFQPDFGKVLSASYRYTRDPLTGQSTVDQLDIAGQWPIAPRWYAVGRYNWSLRDQELLEGIAGVEYNAGCWAVRGLVQRLGAVTGSPNDSFFLQLELTDFGSLGSNPLSLLRRSIPGYGKTNELPTDNALLPTP